MESKDSFGPTEEFSSIELYNKDSVYVMDELAFGQTVGSWNKFNHIELSKSSTSVIDKLAVGQTDISWNEADLIELYDENLANRIDELIVEQIFGCWNELDHFISFYTKSQNFGHDGTNKTSIAKNQQQIRSK
ncbi:2074_t:CDS:2 [Gigaspora margarita]|uniref:2074_t:CDS:1 n=1 Tax=Gigaspora margarita TaxID=4874 RepID=A0ABN7VFN6_GIGMA|nr:2074_t:CDS:2 [Gigaspora margarita]